MCVFLATNGTFCKIAEITVASGNQWHLPQAMRLLRVRKGTRRLHRLVMKTLGSWFGGHILPAGDLPLYSWERWRLPVAQCCWTFLRLDGLDLCLILPLSRSLAQLVRLSLSWHLLVFGIFCLHWDSRASKRICRRCWFQTSWWLRMMRTMSRLWTTQGLMSQLGYTTHVGGLKKILVLNELFPKFQPFSFFKPRLFYYIILPYSSWRCVAHVFE